MQFCQKYCTKSYNNLTVACYFDAVDRVLENNSNNIRNIYHVYAKGNALANSDYVLQHRPSSPFVSSAIWITSELGHRLQIRLYLV